MDVGEPEITAAVSMSQSFMVDAQQMKDGRPHVVNLTSILDRVGIQVRRFGREWYRRGRRHRTTTR